MDENPKFNDYCETSNKLAYKDLRERNNLAVRKSREKLRANRNEMISHFQVLEQENHQLKEQINQGVKDLKLLRNLFIQSQLFPPSELTNFFTLLQSNQHLHRLLVNSEPKYSNNEASSSSSSTSSSIKNVKGNTSGKKCVKSNRLINLKLIKQHELNTKFKTNS